MTFIVAVVLRSKIKSTNHEKMELINNLSFCWVKTNTSCWGDGSVDKVFVAQVT